MHRHNRDTIIIAILLFCLLIAAGIIGRSYVVARADTNGPCEAALGRSTAPLAEGIVESCSSPYWHWGATRSDRVIFYNPTKIRRAGNSAALWDYVVAHERCHAQSLVAGRGDWMNERLADDCASQYADVRFSPYR